MINIVTSIVLVIQSLLEKGFYLQILATKLIRSLITDRMGCPNLVTILATKDKASEIHQ